MAVYYLCAQGTFFQEHGTWESDRRPTGRLLPRRSVYQSGKGDKNSHNAGATASTKNLEFRKLPRYEKYIQNHMKDPF